MYEVKLLNLKTGKTFVKEFYDYRQMRIFCLKVKHGHSLKVISVCKY